MSWYSVIYSKARAFRARSPILGFLLQCSFYVCVVIELLLFSLSSFVYIGIIAPLIVNNTQAAVYVIIYILISFMLFWCYARVILTPPVRVPKEYEMDEATDARLRAVTPFNEHGRPMLDSCSETQIAEQKKIMDDYTAARGITMVETDVHLRLRYCYECRCFKPDRAHHCSSCGYCAVRFDHHCPYLNSCVAYHNYKFFVLFLFYLELWLLWNVIGGLQGIVSYFVLFKPADRLDMIIPLCILFVLQITSFVWPLGELLRYHWQLISTNETTCEQAKVPLIRGEQKANYDQGRWKNIEVVMGWGMWMAPLRTTTADGLHHHINYMSAADAANAPNYRVSVIAAPEADDQQAQEQQPPAQPVATTQ